MEGSKTKILIVGSDGMLGGDLAELFKDRYEVIGANREDFDVTDKEAAEKFIAGKKPDIVINTAAIIKVDDCELNPEACFRVNTIGAYNVAKAAAAVGAEIFYISTDYVFFGNEERFHLESETPNPVNVYGASKLGGEIMTRIANPNYYAIRTSWLFGIHESKSGVNFVNFILQSVKKGGPIKVFTDMFGCPTYTLDFGGKIGELIERNAPFGVYHIANSGFCQRFQMAEKILELAKITAKLEPALSSAMPSRAKRPKYSLLKSENLGKAGISDLRPWEEAVEAYLKIKLA